MDKSIFSRKKAEYFASFFAPLGSSQEACFLPYCPTMIKSYN